MADRPILHLTNWSSRRLHGPGWMWTIMLRPRAWERGHGVIHALTPLGLDRELTSALAERNGGAPGPALAHYRGGYETRVQSFAGAALLNPGKLWAQSGVNAVDVTDGDTLCCACSVAEARAGRCHRAWAAPFLVRAGWRVVLDGVEAPCSSKA